MAIYKRERNFNKILGEICVQRVPLRFVDRITCEFSDGTTTVLNATDFEKSTSEDVACFLKSLDFFEVLTDFNIHIDFGKVESNVSEEVTELLHKIGNDKGNTSV